MNINQWGKTVAASLAIILALASVKAFQIQQGMAFAASFPEHSESVRSGFTRVEPYVEQVTVLGDVVAPQQLALYSESPARIVEVGFTSGAAVQQGDILIQQDISEEQALLDAAQARLGLAESIHRRHKKLYATNAVSEEQFDRAKVELATITAEIARLKSVIRKKTIIAPFAGQVGIHQFEVGQFLLDNILITQLVGDQDYLWIDFYVPQFYPLLPAGSQVEVSAIGGAARDGKTPWIAAEVIAQSTQVDTENRSYRYRARIDRATFPAGINTAVSVRIPVSETRPVIVLPTTAIQHDHLGQFVHLLVKDKSAGSYRATRQTVSVIAQRDGQAYVSEGLTENQLVANDGAFKLYPGLLVHSQPPAPVDSEHGRPAPKVES